MPTAQTSGDMPGFSWLGLLLGGRGYAAQYYGLRDRVAVQQPVDRQLQQERAMAAQGLIGSPEYQRYLASPYDRAAGGALWARMQGMPEAQANLGNSLLGTITSQAYGLEGEQRQNQ